MTTTTTTTNEIRRCAHHNENHSSSCTRNTTGESIVLDTISPRQQQNQQNQQQPCILSFVSMSSTQLLCISKSSSSRSSSCRDRRDHMKIIPMFSLCIRLMILLIFTIAAMLIMNNNHNVVMAYPNGTGSCIGGMPATQFSQHSNPLLHPIILNRNLSFYNISVIIESSSVLDNNNITLQPNTIANNNSTIDSNNILLVQKEYKISVIANNINELQFIGVLIRLQALNNQSNISTALVEEYNLQNANYICNPFNDPTPTIIGLTHYNNSEKTKVIGILYLNDIGNVNLDVTVVLPTVNSSVSAIGYNNYTLSFIESNDTINTSYEPTLSPSILQSDLQTERPSDSVTTEPSISTTNAPSDSSTIRQTDQPSISPSIQPTSVPTGIVTTSTFEPSVSGTSITTEKNTQPPISAPLPPDIDLNYTQLISDSIENIQLTFNNVPTLRLSDLRNVEVIFTNWYEHFYNNRTTQLLPNINTNTSSAFNNVTNRYVRYLQQSSDTATVVAPQLFVVQGTMETKISILNQSITTSVDGTTTLNTIRYNQQLSYRIYLENSPSLPNTMTGSNYVPLSPFQYIFIPYRSTSGNADLVTSLQINLPTGFSNIISPIQVPQSVDSGSSSDSNSNTDDSSSFTPVMIGVIAGGVVLILLIAIYGMLVRKKSSKDAIISEVTTSNNNNATMMNTNASNISNTKEDASPSLVNPLAVFRKSSLNNSEAGGAGSSDPPKSSFIATLRRASMGGKANKPLVLPDKHIIDDPSSYDGESQYTSNNASLKEYQQSQQSGGSSIDKKLQREELSDYMLDNYSLESPKRTTSMNNASHAGDAAAGGSSMNSPDNAPVKRNSTYSTNYQGESESVLSGDNDTRGGGEGNSAVISEAESSVVSGYSKYTYNTGASEEYVVYAPSGKLGIVVDNPDDDSGPIIYAIKETSPLLDSQLNVGDRLVMVDEIDVTKMPPELISKLISKRAQNPMRKLTLHRSIDSPAERMAV